MLRCCFDVIAKFIMFCVSSTPIGLIWLNMWKQLSISKNNCHNCRYLEVTNHNIINVIVLSVAELSGVNLKSVEPPFIIEKSRTTFLFSVVLAYTDVGFCSPTYSYMTRLNTKGNIQCCKKAWSPNGPPMVKVWVVRIFSSSPLCLNVHWLM